jgi:acetylornithine deacetylase/succinyl-diaminopimelate desuccinylase family protein
MVDEQGTRAAEAVDPEEVLGFARALIGAPSENPGGTEEEAAAVASGILEDLGAEVEIVRSEDGRPSVVGRLGMDGPSLAWNGHLDVVPAGSPDTWTAAGPWEGLVRDGRLIGRGASDMKGSIASALAAAAAIRRSGIELLGRLEFHLVADEELAGVHGTRVLWERGYLHQDAAIVGEPSELKIALAERGGAWLRAVAKGRSAHGSQPHLGVNAVTSMARFLLRLPEVLPDLEHPLVGRPTVNVGLISGGSAPNVVPDRCEVDIDRRTIPGETDLVAVQRPFEELVDRIRAEHSEVDIELTCRQWLEAAEAPEDSAVVNLAKEAVAAVLGTPPVISGLTGITDARFYINDARIPTIILGPGSLTQAHTANESVSVAELHDAARIYAHIFTQFLAA